MTVTLKEIAQKAGVSIPVASGVSNNVVQLEEAGAEAAHQ